MKTTTKNVRWPAVAGSFYPEDTQTLRDMVSKLLNNAKPPELSEKIRAIIVPHAGLLYSGPIAAHAYRLLLGRKFETVILIGASHYKNFTGAALPSSNFFATPLGETEIDKNIVGQLLSQEIFRVDDEAHMSEHSLEIQIPFLQSVLPKVKIVPILIGGDEAAPGSISRVLRKFFDAGQLVIGSSDLSHYPNYRDAVKADVHTISAIMNGSPSILDWTLRKLEKEKWPNTDTFLCGELAVKTVADLMSYYPVNRTLLAKGNSGDTAGDKNRVVGYAALAYSLPCDSAVSEKDSRSLIDLAQSAVYEFILNKKTMSVEGPPPSLRQRKGAFVTIKKDDELRGCIGSFEIARPLGETVARMAIAAAAEDYRFKPVSKEELPNLEFEISILSPRRRINSVGEIILGKHGVEIVRGEKSGVFLPQVATENGWDMETFLNVLCSEKAGLPRDAWQYPDTEIYVFETQIIE